MKVISLGGGPAGLYTAILLKKANPSHDITVYERNRPDDTFGFGVVFSDATLENFEEADHETYKSITGNFAHWDGIDIRYNGHVLSSEGHGFSGLSRQRLLQILIARCEELNVDLHFETEIEDVMPFLDKADLVLGADGVDSLVRKTFAEELGASVDMRPNKFAWMATMQRFPAFNFIFKRDTDGGLWWVHAYEYEAGHSTFIVETTEGTWAASGLTVLGEDATVAFCEERSGPSP